MRSKSSKTAVRPRLNLLGRRARRRLTLAEVLRVDGNRAEVLDLLDRGFRLPMLGTARKPRLYFPKGLVIGGATTPQNQTLANPKFFPKWLNVNTDQTINQNDMVWWDPVNFTLKPLTSPTQVAVGTTGGFCGCAQGGNVPGLYPDPPGGVPSEKTSGVQVQWGGTVGLNLQANDVVDAEFTAVTQAGDAQTVTRGAATSSNRVGFVIVPPPVNPRGAPGATPVSDTVAGGQRIEVWIERKFPTTVLA